MKEIESYLDVNVRKMRICPRCDASHYERRNENTSVTIIKNGVVEKKYVVFEDSGSTWNCLECGLHIYQDGSWDDRKL